MVQWNSSPHPISDVRDWSEADRLELRPDFQRREVWSDPARIMLMDTILRGIPMPKIFLANSIRDGKTYRVVIDGQQRITAILNFLRDQFSLRDPYPGKEKGKKFSELGQKTQDRFLSYSIDFNEAFNASEKEVREVYARVNKYTVALNRQELRRADYPGDFLKVSERLATEDYFEDIRVFTPADRRRCADVEYTSELLAAMIDGIQDKKVTLDSFYVTYSKWKRGHKREIIDRFMNILRELRCIFDSDLDISKTRFRQKADFYTLFLVVYDFVSNGQTINGKDIEPLQKDLQILDENIRPESISQICREYAIKCVSQANSASSRRWRHQFLKSILAGTYIGSHPDKFGQQVFYKLMEDLSIGDSICPPLEFQCAVCEKEISEDFDGCVLAWDRTATVKQIANVRWIHRSCAEQRAHWLVLERPNNAQSTLL